MCLVYNKKATKEFIEKNKGRKTLTAYKVYKVKDGKLFPIFYPTIPLKAGMLGSSRIEQEVGKDEQDGIVNRNIYVNRGIHVFLLEEESKAAEKWYNEHYENYENYVVVPVTCYLSDICAVNEVTNEAVFMTVRLSKKNYDKTLKE